MVLVDASVVQNVCEERVWWFRRSHGHKAASASSTRKIIIALVSESNGDND